jgi:hypothetical protein
MEERRTDYPRILEKLDEIKSGQEDNKVEVKRIATLVEERNNTAIIWRDNVCKKFDKIFEWLEKLPCKERGEMYKHIALTRKLIWGAIAITFGILVSHIGWK